MWRTYIIWEQSKKLLYTFCVLWVVRFLPSLAPTPSSYPVSALDNRQRIPRLGVHQVLALYVVYSQPRIPVLIKLSHDAVDPQPLSSLPGCNLVDGSDVIFISYASFLLMEICEFETCTGEIVEC